MSTETATQEQEEYVDRDNRPAVKARFEPETFEQINQIRRDRGVEWSTVILYGIAEIEQEIPPYHRRYDQLSEGRTSNETTTTGVE